MRTHTALIIGTLSALATGCGKELPTRSQSDEVLPTPRLSVASSPVNSTPGAYLRSPFHPQALSGPTIIDFDDLPDVTPVTNQYQSLGVTFSGATILRQGSSLNPPFPPRSGSNVVYDDPAAGGVITANFANAVSSGGGYITGNRPITLRCFNAQGDLLGTSALAAANYIGAGTGLSPNILLKVTAPGITRCTFNDTGNTFTLDDFTFDAGFELAVTRLSQGDPRWGPNLYDTDPNRQTISALGCALTNLSMGLNFAGVANDPGSLNAFMIANGGFNGTSVDWDAAARSRSGYTLKFNFVRTTSTSALQSLLASSQHPVVVAVNLNANGIPGHFVLATGVRSGQILIADPGYVGRTTLDAYNNLFETRGYVADPPGDISALDIAVGDAFLQVLDSQGRYTSFDPTLNLRREEIPRSVAFIDALANDITGAPATSFTSMISIFQPGGGAYEIGVTGTSLKVFTLSIRQFATDGSPDAPLSIMGVTNQGVTSTFTIQVNTVPGVIARAVRVSTFQSALVDLNNLASLGLINNDGILNALSDKLSNATAAIGRSDRTAANGMLGAFLDQVAAQRGKHILDPAASILTEDAQYLLK